MQGENFNASWKFWPEDDPFELVFSVPENAQEIDLPHDAMFHERQNPDSPNQGSTGFLDGKEYRYYKRFHVPEEWRNGQVKLQFEGIYGRSSVYVNQSYVGGSASGYTEFFLEVWDYLKFGEENEILVIVKCGARNSRWYSGAGIYRDVHLWHGPAVSIEPNSLRFTTLDVDSDGASVNVSLTVCNRSNMAQTVAVAMAVRDDAGTVVAERSYPVRVKSGKQSELRKTIYLDHPKLWSEYTPELYTVQASVTDETGTVDLDRITSGIRKLTLDARHGLRVNGKSVKLRGACLHHDQSILGAATYYDYEYRRVKRLKEAGFNAIRSAHNHASQALLTACDRLGVYVMDELSDAWNKAKKSYDCSLNFERAWQADVESMVAADYNHPSVVLYSTGNEIFEICSEKGMETSRALGDLFHKLDPTRYTTNGINGAFAAGDGLKDIVRDITGKDPGKGDVNVFMDAMANHMPAITRHPVVSGILEKLETTMDVLGYNYMTARYRDDAVQYPDRIMVGSETYPKQIAENWAAIMDTPAAIGDFTWTGWDYMGEVPPKFPTLVNTGGDISAIGVRRLASYYREIVFGLRTGPVIGTQDPDRFGIDRNFGPWQFTDCALTYTYPGKEGKPILVQVCAGGDQVELFQNGKSLGTKPCGKNAGFEARFDAVYEPGELLAVAYRGGRVIGRSVLQTAGEAVKLHVDREEGKELIFLNVQLRDAADRRVFSHGEISIQLEGPAKLLAFGSESALHDCGYEKRETTLTDGCALAILKRTGDGNIAASFQCGKCVSEE